MSDNVLICTSDMHVNQLHMANTAMAVLMETLLCSAFVLTQLLSCSL